MIYIYIYKFIWRIILRIKNYWATLIFSIRWSIRNKHNYTTVGTKFPIDIVKIGNKTYGELNVYSYTNGDNEYLEIGNLVSIANNVSFILGGNHHTNSISTYPFKQYYLNINYKDSFSKGKITISDEVWIGFGVIILSGVTIGKGVVIAAGSLVNIDLPAYSICGGNPVRVIKYRFSNEIIEKLLQIDISQFSPNFIQENIDSFYKPLNNESLNIFLKSNLNG